LLAGFRPLRGAPAVAPGGRSAAFASAPFLAVPPLRLRRAGPLRGAVGAVPLRGAGAPAVAPAAGGSAARGCGLRCRCAGLVHPPLRLRRARSAARGCGCG